MSSAPTVWDRLTARVTPPTYVAKVGHAERIRQIEANAIKKLKKMVVAD